jgi:hypothetical protein
MVAWTYLAYPHIDLKIFVFAKVFSRKLYNIWKTNTDR